jgi:hypothetical protein
MMELQAGQARRQQDLSAAAAAAATTAAVTAAAQQVAVSCFTVPSFKPWRLLALKAGKQRWLCLYCGGNHEAPMCLCAEWDWGRQQQERICFNCREPTSHKTAECPQPDAVAPWGNHKGNTNGMEEEALLLFARDDKKWIDQQTYQEEMQRWKADFNVHKGRRQHREEQRERMRERAREQWEREQRRGQGQRKQRYQPRGDDRRR